MRKKQEEEKAAAAKTSLFSENAQVSPVTARRGGGNLSSAPASLYPSSKTPWSQVSSGRFPPILTSTALTAASQDLRELS